MSFFKISKLKSLIDELIHVQVNIAKDKSSKVTIYSFIDDKAIRYSSLAYYLANEKTRTVDLSQTRSIGGSYLGVEPMGFIWAMRPEPGSKEGCRLLRRDASSPITVNLHAYDGHLNLPDLSADKLLCFTSLERTYLAENVDRIPVKHGRIRGTLFVPKNCQSCPGILDLFGIGGGIMEFRAALLASKGFVTLSLPFFGYEDLPEEYNEQDMTYFEEATDFILQHSKVSGNKIGVIGTSKGAEIACLMSSLFGHKIGAAVIINPIPNYLKKSITYKNETFPHRKFDMLSEKMEDSPKGLIMRNLLVSHDLDDHIPIERFNTQFLFINCLDDQSVPMNISDVLAERLTRAGKSNFKIMRYPGAGHLLEPPYSPLCDIAYVKAFKSLVYYGGSPREHNEAQLSFWREVQNFLSSELGHSQPLIEARL